VAGEFRGRAEQPPRNPHSAEAATDGSRTKGHARCHFATATRARYVSSSAPTARAACRFNRLSLPRLTRAPCRWPQPSVVDSTTPTDGGAVEGGGPRERSLHIFSLRPPCACHMGEGDGRLAPCGGTSPRPSRRVSTDSALGRGRHGRPPTRAHARCHFAAATCARHASSSAPTARAACRFHVSRPRHDIVGCRVWAGQEYKTLSLAPKQDLARRGSMV
jgi:hypothetical protein